MPIANVSEPVEVLNGLDDILREDNADRRVSGIRALFVEVLDWEYVDGTISLHEAHDDLPSDAHLIAGREGISAVYLHLEKADRVTAAAVRAAARSLCDTLSADQLLLFTNPTLDEFHIIWPDLTHAPPRLRCLVARRGEHNRAMARQIASMWYDYELGDESVHDALGRAFSVESMTERLHTEYKRISATVKSRIIGFKDESELDLFTQTLLNRLMFTHLISRKGWLTYEGSTDFLNAIWRDHRSQALRYNFYVTRLEPLFFADLNDNDPALCATIEYVPFLDCGLFEKNELDRRDGVHVPDEAIEPVITELLGGFDFTILDSTLDDGEVAVDPELLGMVFEEMVNERHDLSGYYTPRPVVSFMCREALKGFLSGAHTGLSDEVIAKLVDERRHPEHFRSGCLLSGAGAGRRQGGGPGLRFGRVPAGNDAGASTIAGGALRRGSGRQVHLRPQAGSHPGQPVWSRPRRVRREPREVSPVAFARHRRRRRQAGASSQSRLQDSLRRQPPVPESPGK